MIFMLVEKINNLKDKLEKQVMEKDSYDKIYETSVKIDKLLIKYYKELEASKKVKVTKSNIK